jgi:DNA-binding GntR family transcriptional regulator
MIPSSANSRFISMSTKQSRIPQQGATSETSVIPRSKLGPLIVARLREEIITGKWAPGESLPSHVLSAQFGVSHIPIREAFLVLESEGFLRLAPNRMAIVTEPTVDDTRGKLVLLSTLESLAAELACMQASEDDLDDLATLHAELEKRFDEHDLTGYHQTNLQFHRRIVIAAHNQTLADFHQILTSHLEWARVRSEIRADLLPNAPEQHAKIIDCILRRDAANARKAMEEHSDEVGRVILQRVEEREHTFSSSSLQPAA